MKLINYVIVFVQQQRLLYQFNKYVRLIEHLDCGDFMAQIIVPEAAVTARKFNEIAKSLQKRDPEFPKNWKPL